MPRQFSLEKQAISILTCDATTTTERILFIQEKRISL